MTDQYNSTIHADVTPTRRQLLVGVVAGILSVGVPKTFAADDYGISTAESIHQEPTFKASPKQIYEVLTDAKKFNRMAALSDAMKSMASGAKPATISGEVGGAFSLFGGYVNGCHLELVPNERIVQAWRSEGWKPGEFSIARFTLTEGGSGTKIIFDHRGFPPGTAQHLAEGWKLNYWTPLGEYLAQK